MSSRSLPVLLLCLAAAVGSACASKAQARATPDLPPLQTPPPPPRVLAPIEEPIPSAPATPETPRAPGRPAARAPQRPEARSEPRPEPPKPEVSEPVPAAPPAPVAEPPRTLQTAPPAREDAAARNVREVLAGATRDLARVNVATLSRDERAQYDTARRFVQQAEEALRQRNIVYAGTLADKAATLAAVLLGR